MTTDKKEHASANHSEHKTKSKNNSPWKLIIGIIAAVVVVGLIIFLITQLTGGSNLSQARNESVLSVKDGDGETIDMHYVDVDDYKFRIKVPTSFKKLSAAEIKEEFNSDLINAVYTSEDGSAYLTVAVNNTTLKNDAVKEYYDKMKQAFEALGQTVVDSEYYTVDDHNIANAKLTAGTSDSGYYTETLVFSYEDQTAVVSFYCTPANRNKWEKVGEFMVRSLRFNK